MLTLIENSIDLWFKTMPRGLNRQHIPKDIKLIAHRGAHHHQQGLIENTWSAFEKAAALGCFGIEFDIHATSDGVLVVHHDPDLQRLWGHKDKIASLSYEALHKLVPEIPRLDAVIKTFGKKMHLFIELKAPFDAVDTLFETLSPLTPGEDYHLLSLCEHLFEPFDRFPKTCLLLVASHNNAKRFCDVSLTKPYGGVLGHYLLMRDSYLSQLKSQQQKTGVGFVDSRFSLYRELNRGISWIFTNNAADVAKLLGEL